ncbi:cytochrome P450 2C20-like [Tiliqua scincoides]|uniref:cytochrome P450 2C20-like n=1 Tax=Tiliqua scincoides TaxID=71010 RepID=UPI0034635072
MDVAGTGALFLLCVLFIFFFSTFKMYRKQKELPPGPAPWPFLGNLFQKDVLPLYNSYLKLVKKYGPVFTVWVGPKPTVVLCGYEVVKDALLGHAEEFGGRPDIPLKIPGTSGFTNSDEKKWRELRRFTLSTLRDFGMGKRRMSDRVQEEALCLVEEIAARQGQPFDPRSIITSAVSNVICSVVFGSRFDYKDKVFLEQIPRATDRIAFLRSFLGVVYFAFPKIMNYLPGRHKKVIAEGQKMYTFIHERVKSHMESLDPQNPRDFIDCFLIKLEKDQSHNEVIFSHEDLVVTVLVLFVGGTGTTSQALLYSLLAMAKFPHIQAKVQQEIAEVVGTHRPPSMEDRMKMPFTNAVVHEIQRYEKSSAETFPRAMTRDTEFRGHTIPKGTSVIPLFTSLHFDPLRWETPEEFNPGHFLDEKGEFTKRDAFMPFSAGKRSCPGEALAKMELFLFFSTLLQNFTFQMNGAAEEKKLLSLNVDLLIKNTYPPIQAIKRPL